ncbi:MAG: decaprenylphospho-beta-D-erythro-pentofuranosid-2-ulose 2-reductase [Propionibacteriaceae bacterium]|jgi:decaprenylphospho-beta-D-erythro-pentofuranosid-2-ulose 2-reductase|nr:decaprenylphospho-beta-D-erythro-pentofuranosid-2-ulose 2-reductase [Propionibacteriaceae bacterium]
MINALGNPGRIALFGGTSEIGLAIVAAYLAQAPAHVVLASRPTSAGRAEAEDKLKAAGATSVKTVDFDAVSFAEHPGVVESVWAEGDVDVAVVAFGQLGDATTLWRDQARLVPFLEANFTGAASVGALLADKMLAQGHGQMVVLSSVAGEKVRRSNFVYGSAKAGLDAFFCQLGVALEGTGVTVTVARPGMVRTKMTAGMAAVPLTTDPETAAARIVAAAQAGQSVVWVPGLFRWVMLAFKHLPAPLLRRLI